MKPEIKIINIENRNEWAKIVDELPFKDSFVSAEYASISKDYYGNEPLLFVYSQGKNFITHFFIEKKINTLPFVTKDILKKDYFDIISPEYGGPMVRFEGNMNEKDKESFLNNFFREFDKFCKKNNIVTEFCRLNPFNPILNIIIPLRNAEKNRDVVYIDLTQTEDQIWKNFRKGARSSIKKAQNNGIEIKQEKSKEFVNKIYEIYTKTMQRNQALKEYFHSKVFFELLLDRLRDKVELFLANYKDKTIGFSLFLTYGDICHYFFSGTEEEYFRVCPNNLILNEVIFWAKDKGFKIFHFGGGYQPNDSLFNFKLSFSKTTAEFYVYKKIYDQQIYDILCKAEDRYNKLDKRNNLRSDFFPRYRR